MRKKRDDFEVFAKGCCESTVINVKHVHVQMKYHPHRAVAGSFDKKNSSVAPAAKISLLMKGME